MKRSIGVTVIAVLSLLASLLTLLMGAFLAVLPFLIPGFGHEDSAVSPRFFKLMMFIAALVYMLPAIWGIVTSIGLFRLKEWARISIIVFSVLLILMSAFGGLMSLVVPIPPPSNQAANANVAAGVRVFMTVFAGTMMSIGIWWLVFFTRPKVRQQFVPLQPAVAGGPGVETLSYYLACAIVQLYVGIGLLRLKPVARKVGVAYYGFFLVNTAVFHLAPGGRLRIMDFMQKTQSAFQRILAPPLQSQPTFPLDATRFLVIGVCFGLVGLLVPLYFLVTRKQAYERAAAAAGRNLPTSAPN